MRVAETRVGGFGREGGAFIAGVVFFAIGGSGKSEFAWSQIRRECDATGGNMEGKEGVRNRGFGALCTIYEDASCGAVMRARFL